MYIKRATLATDTDSPETDDRVVITTVHSAKGLEFKYVFIVGLEDGLFPINRAFGSDAEMEEERRLLYVAITRAKQGLHLSNCHRRMMFGKDEITCVPSRFLKEMGFVCERPEEYYYEKPAWHKDKYAAPFPAHAAFAKDEIIAKNDTVESLGYKIGDKVRHEKFGEGTVLGIIDKNTLHIRFSGVEKMLTLMYAKLEKL